MPGVEAERPCVVPVETLDEILGGQSTAAGRAGLDARALVDLVAQRGDLRSAGRGVLPTYSFEPQCRPKRSTTSSGRRSLRAATSPTVQRMARAASMQLRAAADSDPASSTGKNATTPSPTCRPTSPPASMMRWSTARTRPRPSVKYAAVDSLRGEVRRAFEVCEQDCRRPPCGPSDPLHPCEVAQVAARGHGGEGRHPRSGLRDERRAGETPGPVPDARHDERHVEPRP